MREAPVSLIPVYLSRGYPSGKAKEDNPRSHISKTFTFTKMKTILCFYFLALSLVEESKGNGSINLSSRFLIISKISCLVSKRRMEMDRFGFYGDTFSDGWGSFYPAKRSLSDNMFQEC